LREKSGGGFEISGEHQAAARECGYAEEGAAVQVRRLSGVRGFRSGCGFCGS
jgi:hypothetical protein